MLSVCLNTLATHNRAGEITYSHIDGYTYELKITTYTYTLSAADRSYLEIKITNEGSVIAYRDSQVIIPNTTYYWNIYTTRYTFSGPGTYEIIVEDPNRNLGVKNIPNSVNIPFSIKTFLLINPELGPNNAPIMLSPPIHKAALNKIFIHNAVSYDKEGDSLSFAFTGCTGERGLLIENYELPEASNYFNIDAKTGVMEWNTPIDTGIFNVAIEVKEWRDQVAIGKIARDMQIEVYKTDNYPPDIDAIPDYCLFAEDTLDITFDVKDDEDDSIECEINGGPFINNSGNVNFSSVQNRKGYAQYNFIWKTNCSEVRTEPYDLLITAKDNNKDVSLTSAEQFTVKVIGPPPLNLNTSSYANAIRLTWEENFCAGVSYNIYRKSDSSGINYYSCMNGVPVSSGFELVGETGKSVLEFYDNNKGKGLPQGFKYCYIVAAKHNNGALSYPTQIVCSYLKPPLPNIIQTSVNTVNPSNGAVYIKWLKPQGLSKEGYKGPYKYKIYRSSSLWGIDSKLIDSILTTDLNDTSYIDTMINTVQYPYSYKIEMYNEEPGNEGIIGDNPGIASTLYSNIIEEDNKLTLQFMRNVPWVNYQYNVFRLNINTGQYELIGNTSEEEYIDSGLANGIEYCYKIISYGKYIDKNSTLHETVNKSHINCGIPVDIIPPCPPVLSVQTDCDSLCNYLSWYYPSSCEQEVVAYRIYFKPQMDALYDSITIDHQVFNYTHYPGSSNAACYAVAAIDSFNNVSKKSNTVCVDVCLNYELPNTFTPNSDKINDRFIPIKVDATIEKVNMQIFNRWGQLIFETEDPMINWNGKDMKSNKLVPSGVYYYICDVYAMGVMGLQPKNISGFIYIFTQEDAIILDE